MTDATRCIIIRFVVKFLCNERHPKECKFFSLTNTCKFGTHCAFLHVKSTLTTKVEEAKKEISALKSEIVLLKSSIVQSENKLLKNVVEELKSTVETNTINLNLVQAQVWKVM